MELTFTKSDLTMDLNGDYRLTLVISKQPIDELKSLVDSELPKIAKIGLKRKKRSLDANSYCFVLCDKIAEKINSTKEKVYQDAIREVGVFNILLIQNKAVDEFLKMWNKQGLGDYAEVMHNSSKVPDCSVITAYHGSSKYDSKQMARLIDYIVQNAKELGIQTETPDEIERIKSMWGK